MKKIHFICLLLLAHALPLHATAVRVMPLGDSITYDDSYADYEGNSRPSSIRHAYRNYLWYKLRDARYWVDFVGSRVAGTAIRPSFDPENEGYPGETSDFIASHVYGFLATNPADIILLHIGTNDRWSIDSSGNYMSGMVNIFNEIDRYERNYHHHVKIILALIIGRRDNDFASFTNTFNTNLHSLANSRIAQGDDIYIVDMQHNAGLNYHSDFRDPAHPTDGGYAKMANVWYSALRRFLPSPQEQIPTAPSSISSTSITTNSVTLHWNDTSNNETGFKIYKNNALVATLSANTTSYTLNNLNPGTTYRYDIVAYNSGGNSTVSSTTFSTNLPKPSQLAINAITPYSAHLSWKGVTPNGSGFKIYKNGTLEATVGKNTTSYNIMNLESRIRYTYSIRAYNTSELTEATSISFTSKDDYGWLPAVYHVILY